MFCMYKLLTTSNFCIAVLAVAAMGTTVNAAHEPMVQDYFEETEATTIAIPRDLAGLEQIWLSEHNKERARLGLKPLVWDAKLSADAEAHAASMANTDVFEHAVQSASSDAQGENMWMGTAGAYDASAMVGSWIAEATDFQGGTFPNVSKTGNWADIGHYTQLIWPATKSVGCALAANSRDEYMVCRYYPAGNVLGEKIGVK
jgi:hypothetical protein